MQYDQYEILRKAKLSAITRVRTADVFEVIEFHADNQTVDVVSCVRPLVYDSNGEIREDMFGEYKKMDYDKTGVTIFGVPVQQFRCGQFKITAPLSKGDTGVIIFLKNDIENWKFEGGESKAMFVAPFNVNSCVFIPFIPNDSNKDSTFNANSLEIKSKSVIIRVNEETIEIETPEDTGKVSIKGNLEVDGDISTTKNVTAEGDVTATGTVTGTDCISDNEGVLIALSTHIHSGGTIQGKTGGAEPPA